MSYFCACGIFFVSFHFVQCPHNFRKTKLDSFDKVVDLIRTVSRDISPDSSKECDCYADLYQEKENQTDEPTCHEMAHEYVRKLESQRAEIELLNAEIDKNVSKIHTV